MAAIKYLIIIAGPTAIGKTGLSISLAQNYNAEIISSDSRQYYRELHIGTAKPTVKEQAGIKHHFIDSLSIHDAYSIGQFERDVIARLEDRFKENDVMIMTGGSGMHIRAITHGLDDFPDVEIAIRQKWEAIFQEKGIQALQDELAKQDPVYADIVDLQNSRRIIRALSVIEAGGLPFSSYLNQTAKKRSFTPMYIMLDRDREELYDRINRRVDMMIEEGLEEEARAVYPYRSSQALNTIGYKEIFDYFDGNISKSKAIELIKRNSRRYAKRQMTWFRKEAYWNRFPVSEDQILSFVNKSIS